LVDGMNVIATPAGEDAFMVALNKETGEVVWRSEPVLQEDKSFPSYASPILLCWEGRRLIVQSGLRTIVCVDADAGRVLWTHPERTKYDANCATPVYVDGGIFHPIPSGAGGTFLEMSLHANNIRVAEKWRCPMDNVSGGAVAVQGHLYGSAERNGGWMCVNVDTGRVLYNDRTLHKGSVIQAEGHLYCMEERGTMALVKATPKEFLIVSRFAFVEEHRNDVWAHPVLLDGTLYLRYHDELSRYAVK